MTMTEQSAVRWIALRRPALEFGGIDSLPLPRPYCYPDGDGRNALYWIGVKFGSRWAEPVVDIGVEVAVAPRLFWLLDAVARWPKTAWRESLEGMLGIDRHEPEER